MKRYSKELKEEVLRKIRGGRTVADVCKEHGLHQQTVRVWLSQDAGGGSSETLELSRLRRENEQLYRLVGALTLESAKGNRVRRGD